MRTLAGCCLFFFLSAITWETELFSWILRKILLEDYYWFHTVPLYLLQPLESLFNKLSREDRNEMEQEATSPSLILVSKKKSKTPFHGPHSGALTPDTPHVTQDLHSALQDSTGLPQVLGHTCQCCPDFPDTLPQWLLRTQQEQLLL